ncbi:E3 ubiquitin-protein ligase RNF182 [Esox lucius]|uniref:E3 ubiquitin-protein ligase RNF182 n=1 Tax=Esox lucius TaxID=8010 RepID=A0AAY5LDC5_ESOLU|nr:E3 ubiquitin-protein ligase RNF182 [Esox lucius]XP_019910708.1 E3 ubiquitin-protein ligase RNF182 [Esox lucius]
MSQKSDKLEKLDLEVNQSSQPLVYTVEELECKICYNRYDTRTRKPKLLGCLHRVCAKCLKKIVENSSPSVVSCPFCRHETHVPDEEVWLLQDDSNILAILSYQDRARKSGGSIPPGGEVLLTPGSLNGDGVGGGCVNAGGEQSHSSSDCLVITIVEMPGESQSSDTMSMLNMVRLYRPASMASLPCHLPVQKCGAWTSRSLPSFLVGVLCLVYFSSLPLGIYLLMIQQLTLGVVLVSLVPSTLLLCVFYGFCQCLCQEIIQSIAT